MCDGSHMSPPHPVLSPSRPAVSTRKIPDALLSGGHHDPHGCIHQDGRAWGLQRCPSIHVGVVRRSFRCRRIVNCSKTHSELETFSTCSVALAPERRRLMGIFSKDIQTMQDLFLHQLQDVYYAENQ